MNDWPQVLTLGSLGLRILGSVAFAGSPRRSVSPVVTIFDVAIVSFILYEGRFFAVWGIAP